MIAAIFGSDGSCKRRGAVEATTVDVVDVVRECVLACDLIGATMGLGSGLETALAGPGAVAIAEDFVGFVF